MTKETPTIQLPKQSFEGIVVSDKMQKTIVVEVASMKMHPLYRKQYKVARRYKAHDEKGEAKVGDRVRIVPSRPLSRRKKWTLSKVLG
jgi:small subunit ribosomal protein S17